MHRLPDDPRFKHVNVYDKTDVRKGWARERARIKAAAERQAAIEAEAAQKVAPLERKSK